MKVISQLTLNRERYCSAQVDLTEPQAFSNVQQRREEDVRTVLCENVALKTEEDNLEPWNVGDPSVGRKEPGSGFFPGASRKEHSPAHTVISAQRDPFQNADLS